MSPTSTAMASRGHHPTRASRVYIQRRHPVPASRRSVCWATHSSTPIGTCAFSSDLLQRGPAEDARGAHEHGDDEDPEHDQIRELAGDVAGGERLAEPDEEAADHRPRDAADSADDRGGEALEARQEPNRGRDL